MQQGKEGVGSLRANEGFQELEKLYASMPLPLFVIFDLWRQMILKYQFTLGGVGASICGNMLSVISSIRNHRYIGIIQLFKLAG